MTHVAAFLAVALLVVAGVRSTVMQAAMAAAPAAAPADCGMGMAMDRGAAKPAAHGPAKAKALCDFCVVAAQAPIASAPPVVRRPVAVAWRPQPLPPGLGARGPPRFQPRARGPPPLLTA